MANAANAPPTRKRKRVTASVAPTSAPNDDEPRYTLRKRAKIDVGSDDNDGEIPQDQPPLAEQDYTQAYEIKTRAPKGTFLRARRPIKPGEIILSEPQLLTIRIPPTAWKDEEFYSIESAGITRYIAKAIGKLPLAQKTAFKALIDHGEGDVGRVKYNSFNGDDCFHVFHDISRLNHSCIPNAWVTMLWSGSRLHAELRAVKNIRAKEDTTIWYPEKPKMGKTMASWAGRRDWLRENYKLDCVCPACKDPKGERGDASRQRRKMGKTLYKALSWCDSCLIKMARKDEEDRPSDTALKKLATKATAYVAVMEEEGICDEDYVEA